jgi:hypothetical protein
MADGFLGRLAQLCNFTDSRGLCLENPQNVGVHPNLD